MSHELTIRSNGSAEMAFAGEGAWHGLGQRVARGASIEEWATAAGMDWRVKRSKVRFATGHGQGLDDFEVDDNNHVLFRSDSKAPLGIVSSKYQVVQPRECLEFFRDLSGANGFEIDTAGTLFGGRRFWALASIGENASVRGDKVGGYLLLSTSADGSLATTAKFTTVRVVCNNTLSMSLSAKDKRDVKITHRSVFDADKVKAQLGIARGEFDRFINAADRLARTKVEAVDVQELTIRLLGGEKLEAAKAKGMKEFTAGVQDVVDSKGFKTVMGLFNGAGLGAQLESSKGTAWGWVNAVTQYVDYAAPARNQNNRLNSAWFGAGDDTKTAALELALSI